MGEGLEVWEGRGLVLGGVAVSRASKVARKELKGVGVASVGNLTNQRWRSARWEWGGPPLCGRGHR